MIICLVFIGKVPTYIRYCVQQIKDWSSLPLYLITDDVDYSKDLLVDFDINIINSKDLNGELIDELEKQKNNFATSNGLPGREHLFYYSFLRLFLIENLMKKYNIDSVFHLEIDNLIYYDPAEFEAQFNSKGLSFIYENKGRGSAGIFYARDVESLNHLNTTTLSYINDKGGWNSEMEFLGKYAETYPEKIFFLPHCTPVNSPLYNLSCNFKEFNEEWLFDPSSFGLWLTGIDGIHSDGILSYRKNNWCPAICTEYKYEWLVDDKGRRYIITTTTSGHKCRIFNLHVNCKDLKPHLSRKFKIPSNRTLLTDNSFIGISVKKERVELLLKYANRDEIYYNEGPMNINYSVYNNHNYEDDYELYLKELIKNRFCICYKDEQILECVYLGVIPIVRHSSLSNTLKNFIKMVIYPEVNRINLNYIPLPTLRETIYTEDFKPTVVSEDNIISGETFQSIAGVFSLYSTETYEFRKPVPDFVSKGMIDNLSENDWDKLHTSKILQIITELLPYFISNILPKITHKFILICHNCDFGIDTKFVSLLDDERLIHMFSQNTLITHKKLTAIPIGIANSKYNHGKKELLYKAVNTYIVEDRINKIYVNVDPGTNWGHRGPVLNHMRNNPLSVFVNRSSYYDYLVQMKRYKWVCSPKGNGADCHRTWEALYMGCIPLVDDIDNFKEFSKELPIILIKDWSKITLEFLEIETSKLNFKYNMLNFNYWKNKIESLL